MTQKYQVLARKYRPRRFSEVIGQDAIVTTLKNALRFDKIAHAYLFSGSRGVGKTTLARLFARAINCQERSLDCEPCGQCTSCLEIASGQSLDVIEIDGASHRGIDDIRQINETVGYVPSHGLCKIIIIDEVHMLTKEAFNALLKTLEEPPERAKFFLATTEPHKVPPTIISRCQRFDLGRIPLSQIISKLEQIATDLKRTVDPEALHYIATFSEGSLRDAESLFDQILCFIEGTVTTSDVRESLGLIAIDHFFALDTAFSECRLAFAFELVDQLFLSGKDPAHFLEQLIEHYRLLALSKIVGEQALPPALSARYSQSTSLYTGAQCLYLLEYLLTAEVQFQKSISHRISLEAILLHIIRSKNRIPIEVLVRRLSELEESLQRDTEKETPSISSSAILKEVPFNPLSNPVAATPSIKKPQNTPSSPAITQSVATTTTNLSSPTITQSTVVATNPPSPAPAESAAATTTNPPSPAITQSAVVATNPSSPALAESAAELTGHSSPNPISNPTNKHPSHYDTLMRFAAVELEGSFKI